MRRRISMLCTAVLLIAFSTLSVRAADDGQAHPKLNSSVLYGSNNTTVDIVSLTSGAGNVKGVSCFAYSSALTGASVSIFVDGGSAQTIYMTNTPILTDSASVYYTGYIPMNVRFGSSIKVQLNGTAWSQVSCSVSWALD